MSRENIPALPVTHCTLCTHCSHPTPYPHSTHMRKQEKIDGVRARVRDHTTVAELRALIGDLTQRPLTANDRIYLEDDGMAAQVRYSRALASGSTFFPIRQTLFCSSFSIFESKNLMTDHTGKKPTLRAAQESLIIPRVFKPLPFAAAAAAVSARRF